MPRARPLSACRWSGSTPISPEGVGSSGHSTDGRRRSNSYQGGGGRDVKAAAPSVGSRAALHRLAVAQIKSANRAGDDISTELLTQPVLQRFQVRLMPLEILKAIGKLGKLGRELLLLREVFRPA